MPNEYEHRPRRRAGRPAFCMACGVTWPCLAAKDRAAAIGEALRTGHGDMYCRQCERIVDITAYNVKQGRCRRCVNNGALLSRYWRDQGMGIRERTV